jgi:carboxypeptidase Taq
LYSAQLLSAAKKELGDINNQIKLGDFSELLKWMRKKIHSRGSIIEPAELIKEATGNFPSSDEFIEYLKNKISDLYQIDSSLSYEM